MKAHATRLLHLLLTTAILAATLLRVTPRKSPDDTAPAQAPSRTSEKTRARLDDLRPHPRNPRRISPARLEQLQRTLEAEPEMLEARPLIALPDGTVVAGNQRLEAARRLGWETIPVVYADLGEDEVKRWMLLDNRPFGEDDREQAAALLAELEAAGGDLALTGYAPAELDGLLRELNRPTGDPDAAPAVPAAPSSVRGKVYELGPHRLMCGDATNRDDVEKLLDGQRPTLLFTSPPYLDLREYGGKADLTPEHLASFIGVWADHASLSAVNLGVIVRNGEIVRHWDTYIAAAEEAGLRLLSWNVWNREDATSMAAQRMMFPIWHEWVFVFGKAPLQAHRTLPTKNAGTTTTRAQRQANGEMTPPRTYPVADRKRLGSVLTMPSHKGPSAGDHPAVFPVALPEAYIAAVTDRGAVVADSFAGSGSTLIAAERLGRRALLLEIDPGYCDVIRQRYADYTGRPELAP